MRSFGLASSKWSWAVGAAALLSVSAVTLVFAPASAQPPVLADVTMYSESQAIRGSEVSANYCAACHGAELTGGGGAPTLKGPDFLFGWSKKTTKDLVEYIADRMPPGQGHSLTDQEYEDVTAYILSANGFQAGQSDLASATSKPIGQPPETVAHK
jgi:alcohol dehydrogenase (cytochrome c)